MNHSRVLMLTSEISTEISSCSFGSCFDNKLSLIKNDNYKLRSAAGLYLLQNILGTSLAEIDLYYNESGKPLVRDNSFYFNISHSKNAVICSVSDMPIGVDIEFIGEIKEKILYNCFTDNEKDNIKTNEDYFKYWTLKEAYLKNIGTGIDRHLDRLEIIEKNGRILCSDDGRAVDLKFGAFRISDYQIAVCSHDDPCEPKLFC